MTLVHGTIEAVGLTLRTFIERLFKMSTCVCIAVIIADNIRICALLTPRERS